MIVHAYDKSLSRVRLFATLWTVVHQAPISMGFPRHEYWSGLPFPPLEISVTQDQTCISYISCLGRGVLQHYHQLGSPR